jgi:hypothetical protein
MTITQELVERMIVLVREIAAGSHTPIGTEARAIVAELSKPDDLEALKDAEQIALLRSLKRTRARMVQS